MNQANKIIGYYHHSTGTINATMVDTEIVVAVALKTLAKSVIISHNHPSGNLQPSEADRQLTRRLKQSLKLFDVHLVDHIIVTKMAITHLQKEVKVHLVVQAISPIRWSKNCVKKF